MYGQKVPDFNQARNRPPATGCRFLTSLAPGIWNDVAFHYIICNEMISMEHYLLN